jgi:uncharacterized protein YndB with AHSA1/START domain
VTMTEANTTTDTTPVRKTVKVKASVEHAFEVFTSDFDSWWPRSHHIGKSPMTKGIIEEKAGGRCYSEQEDGTECDWGRVLVWEPPRRFVMAWQVSAEFTYEPDLAKSSEVEVRFTPEPGGMTRVDLEHRHFERHGPSAARARMGVDSPSGWTGVLQLFASRVEREG